MPPPTREERRARSRIPALPDLVPPPGHPAWRLLEKACVARVRIAKKKEDATPAEIWEALKAFQDDGLPFEDLSPFVGGYSSLRLTHPLRFRLRRLLEHSRCPRAVSDFFEGPVHVARALLTWWLGPASKEEP